MNLTQFPVLLLLIVTMASCLGNALLINYFTKKINYTFRGRQLYNLALSLICALFLLLFSAFQLKFSLFTLGMGTVFGIVTGLSTVFLMSAMAVGPLSYTTVIASCSTLITAVSGVLFGEKLSPLKILGIALMGCCLVLAGRKGKGAEEKGFSVKWLVLSLMAALCSVGVGLLQKAHQESSHKGELSLFLIIAFLISALLSLGLYLSSRKKDPPLLFRFEEKKRQKKALWLSLLCFAVSGLAVALNNLINLYLVGVMDSAVFFPLVNGGHLILCTLSGLILFQERLTGLQTVGISCGIAATFCLCL